MASTEFYAGWSDLLKIKAASAAAGTALNFPLRDGSSYARNDNSQSEQLAQGTAVNAFPANSWRGIPTTQYGCVTRAFSGSFSAASLQMLFGIAATTGLRTDTTGNIAYLDIGYAHAGTERSDQGKLARMRMAANYQVADAIDLGLDFLGIDGTAGVPFTAGAPTALLGTPFSWEDLSFTFANWTGSAFASPVVPYGVEAWSSDLFTGANYRPNSSGLFVNVGTERGAVSIQQNSGADSTVKMANFTSGKLVITVASGPVTTLQIKRMRIAEPTTVNQGAYELTAWRVESIDGSAPIIFG